MDLNQFKKLQNYAQLSPYLGVIKKPNLSIVGDNPLCGDWIKIYIKTKQGKIVDAKFEHSGCALSEASTSLFIESIMGKSLKEISNLDAQKHLKNLNIQISPARINCALLPMEILKKI